MMTRAKANRFISLLFFAVIAFAQRQPPLPLAHFQGSLKQLDDKTIVVRLDDAREIDFKRNAKTRFFREGKELKAPDFKTGDTVSIEGQQDAAGYLTAVNVRWEGPPSAAKTPLGFDAWAEIPRPEPQPAVKPPAPADPDDPGPPALRRGAPADPARQRSKPVAETPATPAAVPAVAPRAIRPDDDLPFGSREQDPLIRRAADAALDFTESLPNYICRQVISRFQSTSKPADWRLLDTVMADLVFENGKEDYRNLTVNGKPANKSMQELGGAWSTGEFATTLATLFSPATAAEFQLRRNSRIAGIDTREYTFDVTRERSQWTVRQGSQSFTPAYKGAVWIDPASARVLRIEMEAVGVPGAFQTDRVESTTDYEYVRLGTATQYLLPVRAATLTCQTGTNNCFRNTIEFRNYRKFGAESNIQFEKAK